MPDIEDCLRQAMGIEGAIGASLIDYPSGLTVGTVGSNQNAVAARLVRATADAAAFASVGQPSHLEDIVVTAGNGYHLVHFPEDSGGRLALYMWLDRGGNLAKTQWALRGIGAQLAVG